MDFAVVFYVKFQSSNNHFFFNLTFLVSLYIWICLYSTPPLRGFYKRYYCYSIFTIRWKMTFGKPLWVNTGGYKGIRKSYSKHNSPDQCEIIVCIFWSYSRRCYFVIKFLLFCIISKCLCFFHKNKISSTSNLNLVLNCLCF